MLREDMRIVRIFHLYFQSLSLDVGWLNGVAFLTDGEKLHI